MTINKDAPIEEALHFDIDTNLIPNQVREGMYGHNWIQQGFHLVCRSCPCQHSVNIGRNMFMGLDDNGLPILKKID